MCITWEYNTMNKSWLRLQGNWLRQTCNVFVFPFIKHLFKRRDVLHVGCFVEKMIKHIVLIWTIKFKEKSLEVCVTWKFVAFLEFCIFPGYKNINMLKTFLKKLYGPFFMDGVQLPQGSSLEPLRGQRKKFNFYYQVPRNSWYSFYWTQKNERLSWPWSYPVVLNTRHLDWESSTLTTSWAIVSSNPVYDQHIYYLVVLSFVFSKDLFYWELLELLTLKLYVTLIFENHKIFWNRSKSLLTVKRELHSNS